MSEIAQPKRGGKAFHSVVEPHLDFIHQLRQQRKTWKEIAELLSTQKGIRVTLYAPYRFYRRHLKRRAKRQREDETNLLAVQPPAPKAATNRPQKKLSPLPPSQNFQQPDRSKLNTDQFV